MANVFTQGGPSDSSSRVGPQNRGYDSDRVQRVVLPIESGATNAISWSPGAKVQITGLRVCAGANALNATNDVVVDVDIENPDDSTTKKHDVATDYDSAVSGASTAAHAFTDMTLSATVANTVMESDELLKVVVTNATGDGGLITLVVSYVELDVGDPSVTW